MRPGDVVIVGKSVFRITGIYLGAVNSQDLVGLESITYKDGSAHGKMVKEMFVPLELVKLGSLYKEVVNP